MKLPDELFSQIHQNMPIICVDAVVYCNDKILLVKRKCEPMCNEWWFPGGRLLRGERLEQAARRLVQAETGLSAHRQVMLGFDETEFNTDPFGHGNGTHTVNFVYAVSIHEMDIFRIALDDNHIAHSLFSYEDIYKSQMHPYVKRFTALAEGVLRR